MKKSSLLSLLIFSALVIPCAGIFLVNDPETTQKVFIDPRDSQSYPIIKLNETYWMAANLNYHSDYSDCYSDEQIACGDWGRLYPIEEIYYICPEGWRLPNRGDWNTLKSIIDTGGVHALYNGMNWKNNDSASNSSGLSLVPSGFQHKKDFLFQYINSTIWFNDSTAEGSNWHFHTDGNNNEAPYYYHTHNDEVYVRKFAVRCVCDADKIED